MALQEITAQMMSAFERSLPGLVPKPRILVCAPSNAAADELLQRVMNAGFIDGNGNVYRPSVVRVGTPHTLAPQSCQHIAGPDHSLSKLKSSAQPHRGLPAIGQRQHRPSGFVSANDDVSSMLLMNRCNLTWSIVIISASHIITSNDRK